MTAINSRSRPGPSDSDGQDPTSARILGKLPLRRTALWLTSALVAVYLVLGLATPLFATVQQSFQIEPFWRGYSDQLSGPSLLIVLGRTLLQAAVATIVTILLGYPAAYAMTLMRPKMRAVFTGLLVFPYLSSFLVRTYAWIGILGAGGPLVKVMKWLGNDTPTYTGSSLGVTLVLITVFLPVMILMCYVSMSRIDPSHLRAARTLGANHLESFWRVYAPQTKSGVVAGSALVFISTTGMYVTPALIGGPAESTIVSLVVDQVRNNAFGVPEAYPAALAIILAIVVALVVAITARWVGLRDLLGLHHLSSSVPSSAKSPRRAGREFMRPIAAMVRRIPAIPERHHVLVRSMVLIGVLLVDGPFVYMAGMSFEPLSVLRFPTGAWSTRWYEAVLTDSSWLDATLLSIQIAVVATVVTLIVGSFLAMRTTKVRPVARNAIIGAALLPMIVPAVMYATGIFTLFANLGLIGNWVAIALVHSVLALPFVYVNVLNGLNSYDPRWDQAAYSLGASPWRRLWKVTLPLLRPALITGAFFAALTSIDEFTVTLFMGGISFQNLPLKFWAGATQELSPELAVVGILMTGFLVAAAALTVAAFFWTKRATQRKRSV